MPSSPPDAQGNPERLDLAAPKAQDGQPYYQLNGAPGQSIAVHMHQSGPEQGTTTLGAAQLHYEGGRCVNLQDSLESVDVLVSERSLSIEGEHQQVGRAASYQDGVGIGQTQFFLQAFDGSTWVWSEVTPDSVLYRQPEDGEAFVVAFGEYSPTQVQQMQQQVPAPISRGSE